MTADLNNLASPEAVTKDDQKSTLSSVFHSAVSKGFTMYPVILLLIIIGSIFAPRFLTTTNVINILAQVVVLGLVTLGLTFVLLIGRLDLSLEAIVGFVPM